ncbi:MAG TPA: agmatine deiminase family protein [Patescibacteria group bacterium]|nr:agmatine deiminase family protein [Patescibacteria group bacterium]
MTPKQLGFYMPAEWAEHEAVWMAWPHDPVTFPDRIPNVEKAWAKAIKALQDTDSEKVYLLVPSAEESKRIAGFLELQGVDISKVFMLVHDYVDVWLRDTAPTFLLSRDQKELAMVDWDFNAWGNKYADLLKDGDIRKKINSELGLKSFEPGVVMEGGGFEVNGKGTVMTTKQCLLNPNRNPNLSQAEIEAILKDYLGCTHIVWLDDGVEGDDTDGHIDDIARFVAPDTILYAYEEDVTDPNHAVLEQNFKILQNAVDQDGNPFKLIRIPMPKDKGKQEVRGRTIRLPESYVNFYIANKAVLTPIFRTEYDAKALEILQSAFPERAVVPIDCSDWIYGMGTLHCSSQQQPKLQ